MSGQPNIFDGLPGVSQGLNTSQAKPKAIPFLNVLDAVCGATAGFINCIQLSGLSSLLPPSTPKKIHGLFSTKGK